MINTKTTPDIVIIGSGMGGACVAYGLAATGANILILEQGHQLPRHANNRDARAIFQQGFFRTDERWYDGKGEPFGPGNYYYHGGNTKFYGAVLMRYRAEDFDGVEHLEGTAPPWPFRYDELEPWYQRAEELFNVRGELGADSTEPRHSGRYSHAAVPDEPAIAELRARLKSVGLNPASLPLGIDIEAWLAEGQTPWDAFPDARSGKMDAETCALIPALKYPNVRIESGAEVLRLIPGRDGHTIVAVEYRQDGEVKRVSAGTIVLAAGAVRSAKILLASGESGLANRSGAVGRHFMNHNLTALLAYDRRFWNDSVYQKTFGINDFYLRSDAGDAPLGHVQLFGRVSATVMKGMARWAPEWLLDLWSRHSADLLLMSEDIPDPESRVTLDGDRLVLHWKRSNMKAHGLLRRKMTERLKAAGFSLTLSRPFDRNTTSHQCGTVRIGNDPVNAPLNADCRSFDHPNLYVTDASCLVTSAAVNPSLTVAALALRAARSIREDFGENIL
ncbi:choline dehydrogenase-like flavoprotein [Shinella sp. BE166]|uniref:FAD-dependent oxidoreductase n=1 Tax=Shinella sp. BE166 TaxID=3373918 RepID=UPI003EC023C8